MPRSGTEAIRTQIQPSKSNRETYITNSQNTKRTHGQPSQQLFPKNGATQQPKPKCPFILARQNTTAEGCSKFNFRGSGMNFYILVNICKLNKDHKSKNVKNASTCK